MNKQETLVIIIDLLYVTLFSYIGFCIRWLLGEAFDQSDKNSNNKLSFTIFREFYANVIGCLVMGFLAELHKLWLLKHAHRKRFANILSVGLMTGFCGCLTSFSSWQQDCVSDLVHGRVASFFLKEIIGLCVPYFALCLGHDIANMTIVPLYTTAYDRVKRMDQNSYTPDNSTAEGIAPSHLEEDFNPPQANITTKQPPAIGTAANVAFYLFIAAVTISNILATALFIVLLCVDVPLKAKYAAAAFLLCPFGCALRYVCGLFNARLAPRIPLFTLLANILGCVITGFARVTESRYHRIEDTLGLDIFFLAVAFGFCGCLTTVSSFVEEFRTKIQGEAWKYLYLALSILLAIIVLFIINAAFVWS